MQKVLGVLLLIMFMVTLALAVQQVWVAIKTIQAHAGILQVFLSQEVRPILLSMVMWI